MDPFVCRLSSGSHLLSSGSRAVASLPRWSDTFELVTDILYRAWPIDPVFLPLLYLKWDRRFVAHRVNPVSLKACDEGKSEWFAISRCNKWFSDNMMPDQNLNTGPPLLLIADEASPESRNGMFLVWPSKLEFWPWMIAQPWHPEMSMPCHPALPLPRDTEIEDMEESPPTPGKESPPTPGTPLNECVKWLGNGGVIFVLFETPSGFAIFSYNGIELFRPNAQENVWADFAMSSKAEDVISLKEFQIFEDKTSAFGPAGVSDQLTKMITQHLSHNHKLAVEKYEHKKIIEENLGVYCLHNEAVMEVFWGLKNLMQSLVPQEKIELTQDCIGISQGMKKVMARHGFNVETGTVTRDIVEVASVLYECDCCNEKHTKFLLRGGEKINEVSNLNTQDWELLKLATGLKLISYPEEEVDVSVHGSSKVLSIVEARKLITDSSQYEEKLDKRSCLIVYKQILHSSEISAKAHKALRYYAKEAG